jgi:hypothetical protein
MSGGGSKGGGKTTTEIRYAPYVEDAHKAFLDQTADEIALVIHSSPFAGYAGIDYLSGFFGLGFTLSSFPSLFDMYGKFVAGLDVDALYTQILEDSINSPVIDNLVSQQAIELADDIIQNASPRFEVGMRDINSVISSSFVVGRALMETARTKSIAKYDASLRFAMMPIASTRWTAHLDWNKSVTSLYAEYLKFYFVTAMDMDNHNYSMITKDVLWPFTVLDYQRVALGCMQGATNAKSDVEGMSTTSKVIGGALTGGVAGAMIAGAAYGTAGGPTGVLIGAGIGAVIGGAAAFMA